MSITLLGKFKVARGTTADRVAIVLEVGELCFDTNLNICFIGDGVTLGGIPAIAGQLAGINDQTGTAYTLALSDIGKDIRCTNAAAITLTVPPNSAVAFPVGTWLLFSQGGAGVVTATAGAGVTLRAANGAATSAQYDARGLEYLGGDVWRVW